MRKLRWRAWLFATLLGVGCGGRTSLFGGHLPADTSNSGGDENGANAPGGSAVAVSGSAGNSAGGVAGTAGQAGASTQGGTSVTGAGAAAGGVAGSVAAGAPGAEAGGDGGDGGDASVVSCDPGLVECQGECVKAPCILSIAAGEDSSCALLGDGEVACWGHNFAYSGEGYLNDTKPLLMPGLPRVTQIGVDIEYACVLLEDSTVDCWGADPRNALQGNGSKNFQATPTPIPGLKGAKSIYVGEVRACATLADDSLVCWGTNNDGELGNGTTDVTTTPVAVKGLKGVRSLALGPTHSCAVLADSTVSCWGNGQWGALGDGNPVSMPPKMAPRVLVPTPVPGLKGATSVAANRSYTCVTLSDKTVSCWGRNFRGQLGDGTTTDSSTPQTVPGVAGVKQVVAGGVFACALLEDGTVMCWGSNLNGALGNGTNGPGGAPFKPAVVPSLSGIRLLDTGSLFTIALASDNSIWGWGYDGYGELGDAWDGAAFFAAYSATPIHPAWPPTLPP